jgi:hypothetical protein
LKPYKKRKPLVKNKLLMSLIKQFTSAQEQQRYNDLLNDKSILKNASSTRR